MTYNNIYYCDYKFRNIVFDYENKIKLIDLGTIVFKFEDYGVRGYTDYFTILIKIAKKINE